MSEIVALRKPGDKHLLRQVVRGRGNSDADSPVTVDEMIATFGPNWSLVRELVRQAAVMTDEQVWKLGTAWGAAPNEELRTALDVVREVAQKGGRQAIVGATWWATAEATWGDTEGTRNAVVSAAIDGAAEVAMGAAGAFVVCDLVGQHGLTQKHMDTLLGLWRQVVDDPPDIVTDRQVDAQYEHPFALIFAEVRSATKKHPGWPTDPTHAIAIIQEELGEATRAVCQATYEGKGGETIEDARQEIVQTAAMCMRWLANFDNYVIRPSERVVGDGR